mmetsp:Transcript_7467/g.25464  ORF Transcript_7467/g.25464 Transcript_7467/m.25464 type:complete len:324 (-) Transcript_7467:1396-2367(-)
MLILPDGRLLLGHGVDIPQSSAHLIEVVDPGTDVEQRGPYDPPKKLCLELVDSSSPQRFRALFSRKPVSKLEVFVVVSDDELLQSKGSEHARHHPTDGLRGWKVEDGYPSEERVCSSRARVVVGRVQGEVTQRSSAQVVLDRSPPGEDETVGGDAGSLQLPPQVPLRHRRPLQHPQDSVADIAQQAGPGGEGHGVDLEVLVEVAEDEARGRQEVVHLPHAQVELPQRVEVELRPSRVRPQLVDEAVGGPEEALGEEQEALCEGRGAFRGSDDSVRHVVVYPGGSSGPDVAVVVHLDRSRAKAEDILSVVGGVSYQVEEDADAC